MPRSRIPEPKIALALQAADGVEPATSRLGRQRLESGIAYKSTAGKVSLFATIDARTSDRRVNETADPALRVVPEATHGAQRRAAGRI
jgi:hypothetical protein